MLLTPSDSYRQLDKLRNAEAVQIQDELAFSQELRKLINGGEVRSLFQPFLVHLSAQSVIATDQYPKFGHYASFCLGGCSFAQIWSSVFDSASCPTHGISTR